MQRNGQLMVFSAETYGLDADCIRNMGAAQRLFK